MNYLKEIDTCFFLLLNGLNHESADIIMWWISYKFTWIPLYAFLLYLIWRKSGSKILPVILSVAILIFLSDQISVHLFKNVFERYRPCHNLFLEGKVHLVGDCGGLYGFVSSHAANTFALAVFLSLFFRIKKYSFLLLMWAALCSYSRIYLGVHYPADIIAGALLGGTLGFFVFYAHNFIVNKRS